MTYLRHGRQLFLPNSLLSQFFSTSKHLRWPAKAQDPAGDFDGLDPKSGSLTPEQAKKIINTLSDGERAVLKNEITQFEATHVKAELEGKLAATRWRSRFGRPTKVPALGKVDPSGAYCAVPEDWLYKKFVENAVPPSKNDLMKLWLVNSLPFIGFGFLDNFIMIIAGDYIESTLGAYIGISTLAAAGLGNTFSDVMGIGSAYYVEKASEAIGVKAPKLTQAQLDMNISRRYANLGRIIGITIGCLLGMCPLLFIRDAPSKDKKAAKQLQENVENVTIVSES